MKRILIKKCYLSLQCISTVLQVIFALQMSSKFSDDKKIPLTFFPVSENFHLRGTVSVVCQAWSDAQKPMIAYWIAFFRTVNSKWRATRRVANP